MAPQRRGCGGPVRRLRPHRLYQPRGGYLRHPPSSNATGFLVGISEEEFVEELLDVVELSWPCDKTQ